MEYCSPYGIIRIQRQNGKDVLVRRKIQYTLHTMEDGRA